MIFQLLEKGLDYAPYIIVCVSAEEHIMVEQESLDELSTFKSAIIHLLAACFVFDPSTCYSTLMFGLTTSLNRMASISP